MENKLKALIASGDEKNRAKWAQEWKKQGKKVIGMLCTYAPVELVYASGVLPWYVIGTPHSNTPLALMYRAPNTCRYSNHVLESFLREEFNFLDGIIGTDWDDDSRALFDVLEYLGKAPFGFILHLPHQDFPIAHRMLASDMSSLRTALQDFAGKEISDESIRHAANIYNKTRTLIMKAYELRKREVPPLSGAEFFRITLAALVMPPEEFNSRFEELLPYLEERKTSLKNVRPRVMISSDRLHNVGYLDLIEEIGPLVAMDDLDTGSRYFSELVDTNADDIIYALAQRYMRRSGCPRMIEWNRQVKTIIAQAKEFKIDGVIELPLQNSWLRQMRVNFLARSLAEAGISNISLLREYHLANIGQLRTRIQAFGEVLEARVTASE